jgi:hypothetical protein
MRRAILTVAAGAFTVLILLVLALVGLERAASRIAPLTTSGRGSEVTVSLVS